MPFRTLTYQDILNVNLWCQEIVAESITPTYGIRDDNLLSSIPESVIQSFDGIDLYPTVYDKCAYLWFSLSQYHCFADGNKRTTLVTTVVLLMLNGFNFETSANDLYDICIGLASSKLSSDEICRYLMNHTIKDDKKIVIYPGKVNEILSTLSKDVEFINVLKKLGN